MTQGTIKRIYDNSDDRGHNFGLYFAEPENEKAYLREDMSSLDNKSPDLVLYSSFIFFITIYLFTACIRSFFLRNYIA